MKRVTIIGAGIVGAACAYYLSGRGADVTILERAPSPASESTGKSAAGIRHQFTHPQNVRMSRYSALEFSRFEALTGVPSGYRRVGYLFLVPPLLWPTWCDQVSMQQREGARVELLELPTLLSRYPINPEGLAGASYGADDGVLDPHGVTMGYLAAAKRQGASLRLETTVTDLSFKRGEWHIGTDQGNFTADAVINAAGAFSGKIGKLAGFEIPVFPYRRNVYVTGPTQDYPHPSPLMIDMTTGVWLRSEGERFILGLSNLDEAPGNNQSVDWNWLEHTLELALPRFPFLETAGLDRRACWAGLYEITPDHLPILGQMPGAEGFYNACGFSGHGVQHAPATGLILAEEIMDGAAHSFDITDFRYERFSGVGVRLEANVV